MNTNATPRTAIITGGARGIGLATAEVLADRGDRLVLVDLLADTLAEAENHLASRGADVRVLAGDVSDPNLAPEAMALADREFGGLDILVNNAGISPKRRGSHVGMETLDLDEWHQVLAVNLTSVFLFCKAAIDPLKAGGWGRIVNMSSQAARGRSGVPSAHYTASKAGVIGMSRTLAAELAPHGVTVNCVAPGRINSAMTAASGPEINDAVARNIPIGKLGEPEDIAAAVAYLTSDGARYVTGAVLDVNGGFVMA